jgi:hypothetical protein
MVEFKEFAEFKELAFTIRSPFEAPVPATPETLTLRVLCSVSALKSCLLELLEFLELLELLPVCA